MGNGRDSSVEPAATATPHLRRDSGLAYCSGLGACRVETGHAVRPRHQWRRGLGNMEREYKRLFVRDQLSAIPALGGARWLRGVVAPDLSEQMRR